MIRHVVRVMIVAGLMLPMASCSGTKTNPLLPGTWEITGNRQRCSVEFTKEGKVHLSGDTNLLRDFQFVKVFAEFNLQPGMDMITYRAVSEKELEIEGDYTALMDKLGAGAGNVSSEKMKEAQQLFHPKEQMAYTVTAKELTLTNGSGKSITLKRVE